MRNLTLEEKILVKQQIADKICFEIEDVEDESYLRYDLGIDSLDEVELIMDFEDIFDCNIPDELVANVETVSDIYECISKCIN